MKQIIASLVLTLASTSALAHSGSHTLTCKSASNAGSTQVIEVSLHRANNVGLAAPEISVTVDGSKFVLSTPNDMKSYGDTVHNSPLGVITVTANNFYEKKAAVTGLFSVVAIPSSVRAFDTEGNPVKWSLQAEKDECNDENGTAKFQGIIHGVLDAKGKNTDIDPQILDCELEYNSGMAC